jgi:hypothetical protein
VHVDDVGAAVEPERRPSSSPERARSRSQR